MPVEVTSEKREMLRSTVGILDAQVLVEDGAVRGNISITGLQSGNKVYFSGDKLRDLMIALSELQLAIEEAKLRTRYPLEVEELYPEDDEEATMDIIFGKQEQGE